MPAASSALSNKRPAGPTKGLPVRSSSLPGCSPINMTLARREPSPKTVCVPFFQRSQARQPAAAFLTSVSVGRGGIKSQALLSEEFAFGICIFLCVLCDFAVNGQILPQRRRDSQRENLFS